MRNLACFTVVLVLALLTGCSTQSQTQQWRNSAMAYRIAVTGMTDAANAGVIDLEDAERFEKIRKQVRLYLDEWEAANAAGAPFNAVSAVQLMLQEMVRLAHSSIFGGYLANPDIQPPPPSTGPLNFQ